jgi:hypothetical protein
MKGFDAIFVGDVNHEFVGYDTGPFGDTGPECDLDAVEQGPDDHPCYYCHPSPCECATTIAAGPADEKTDRGPTDRGPIELINHGSYDFIDISSEMYRTYDYIKIVDDEPVLVGLMIENPQWLAVSKTGHRILDIDGDSHYIPYGWIHLTWTVRPGCPHFVK